LNFGFGKRPMQQIFYITGTDTGAGKTVFTALLAAFLHSRGVAVGAFKPVCSGGREDARILQAALGGALELNTINPWHFRSPIAPVLAARKERKTIKLFPVLAHLRATGAPFEVMLIEGAGGLLSPLGTDFNSRDLMSALKATPVVVAPNQLGVVNHVLLTLEALPARLRTRAQVVLMARPKPDTSTASNMRLLAQSGVQNLAQLRWLGAKFSVPAAARNPEVRAVLEGIIAG
jgi:dethiobiotin synthetase